MFSSFRPHVRLTRGALALTAGALVLFVGAERDADAVGAKDAHQDGDAESEPDRNSHGCVIPTIDSPAMPAPECTNSRP